MKACKCGHDITDHEAYSNRCHICGCLCRKYDEREWVILDRAKDCNRDSYPASK